MMKQWLKTATSAMQNNTPHPAKRAQLSPVRYPTDLVRVQFQISRLMNYMFIDCVKASRLLYGLRLRSFRFCLPPPVEKPDRSGGRFSSLRSGRYPRRLLSSSPPTSSDFRSFVIWLLSMLWLLLRLRWLPRRIELGLPRSSGLMVR